MFLKAGRSTQRPYLSCFTPGGAVAAAGASGLDKFAGGDTSRVERRRRGGESECLDERVGGESTRRGLNGGSNLSDVFGGRVVALLGLCCRDGLRRRGELGSSSYVWRGGSGIASAPTYS